MTPGAVAANIITAFAAATGIASVAMGLGANLHAQLYLVVAAVCLDTLDGAVARRFNGATTFGRYADSVSDFITFGLSGGVLVSAVAPAPVGPVLGLGWTVVTGWRLYRFARVAHAEPHFVGLPSSAAVLCLFVLALNRDVVTLTAPWIGVAAPVLLAAGMLLPLRFTKSGVVIGGCMIGGAALGVAAGGLTGASLLFAGGFAGLLYTGIGLAAALRGGELWQKARG